jgi:hypothetical protein
MGELFEKSGWFIVEFGEGAAVEVNVVVAIEGDEQAEEAAVFVAVDTAATTAAEGSYL